MADGDINIMQR